MRCTSDIDFVCHEYCIASEHVLNCAGGWQPDNEQASSPPTTWTAARYRILAPGEVTWKLTGQVLSSIVRNPSFVFRFVMKLPRDDNEIVFYWWQIMSNHDLLSRRSWKRNQVCQKKHAYCPGPGAWSLKNLILLYLIHLDRKKSTSQFFGQISGWRCL